MAPVLCLLAGANRTRYLNKVPDFKELHRLAHNQALRDVDVRLNPASAHDPEYRLFLVHLLPNLVRLDDHDVTAAERTASLHYFTTDQTAEMYGHTRVTRGHRQGMQPVAHDGPAARAHPASPHRGSHPASPDRQSHHGSSAHGPASPHHAHARTHAHADDELSSQLADMPINVIDEASPTVA